MNSPNWTAFPALAPPTRVRYGVLGFACALSMITYLDRVCFGTAASYIVSDLGLTSVADLKWAFTAFTLAYASFEIPSGWLGDVFGPRRTLVRIVLWWSLFTALTGLVGVPLNGTVVVGVGLLVVIRFLFGMGEAGAYPNITRALHNWLPLSERGFGQGAVWMAGRLMGGLTPLIWTVLIEGIRRPEALAEEAEFLVPPLLHWREAFWTFGLLGIAWCVLFTLWFRNRPEEKETVNAAELALIRAGREDLGAGHAHVPWLRLLSNGNLWLLCLMYACASYGWYFNITYLPRFLEQQYDVHAGSLIGAVYKGGPLWLGALGCLLGGWLTDGYIRRTGNRRWGRRLFGLIGHSLCGLCYLACLFTGEAFTFFLAISLAAFCNDLTMGASWALCQDIGRRYAAIVAGCMNTVGNLGGAAANLITGLILEAALETRAAAEGVTVEALSPAAKAAGLLPGYQVSFVTFALVYLIAVVLWLRIDANQPVLPDDA